MRRSVGAVLVLVWVSGSLLVGGVEDVSGLRTVEELLERGMPTVALAKLDVAVGDGEETKEEAAWRAVLRARALVALGEPSAAVEVLSSLGEERTEDGWFWLGEAQAALGEEEEALKAYEQAGPGEEAVLGRAKMLALLGRTEEAIAEMRRKESDAAKILLAGVLVDAGRGAEAREVLVGVERKTNAVHYLMARVEAGEGETGAALENLGRIKAPRPSLATEAVVLRARLEAGDGRLTEAEDALETYIETHPRSAGLGGVFAMLDEVYAAMATPSVSELRRWADDLEWRDRAIWSLFYLGRAESRQGRVERAIAAYETFAEMAPEHELADAARSELAGLYLGAGRLREAVALVGSEGDGDSEELRFMRGLVLARAGDFQGAAKAFRGVDGREGRFNEALCGVLGGERLEPEAREGLSEEDEKALMRTGAAVMAARREPSAGLVLAEVAERGDEWARLALAEWFLVSGDRQAAGRQLRRVSQEFGPEHRERAEAMEVYLADDGTAANEPRVIAAAEAFLAGNPGSEFRAVVAMKLGEVLFRRGDYVSARIRFDEVAGEPGVGELGEKARFLAGQSAARSMDLAGMEEAIEIYEDVARGGGELVEEARLAQAFLLNDLGRGDEALAVLESLAGEGADERMRLMALLRKGDILYARGVEEASAYGEAIATWRLAAEPGTPARWRNEAMVKIGAASERMGEMPAALSSYYDVLSAEEGGEPEYFWYFKAGFDAARLLESEGKLEEAAAVYEQLAAKGGPRSEEAGQRLSRLKLENFLWEE